MDTSMFHGSLVTTSRILYTPSAFARTSLIHLQETGSLRATKPHTSQRENLASYLFFLVCSGGGTLQYAGRTRPLRAGDCVFLDCQKPYSHRTSDDLWQLKWVHFYGPNMNSIYDKYTERGGGPCFHPKNPEPYDRLLNKLYETAASEDHVRDMRIFETLAALLTLLMEESWDPESRRHSPFRKQDLQEIKEYLDRLVSDAKEKGYITTMYGRRRPIPELASSNFMQRSFGERVAMNSPIQGTAADIIKIAMIRVWNGLRQAGLSSRLILQVHDELVIETCRDETEQVRQILEESMKQAADLAVPLEVDLHTGDNWYEAH